MPTHHNNAEYQRRHRERLNKLAQKATNLEHRCLFCSTLIGADCRPPRSFTRGIHGLLCNVCAEEVAQKTGGVLRKIEEPKEDVNGSSPGRVTATPAHRAVIENCLQGLHQQGKSNAATVSPPTVLYLAVVLERVLITMGLTPNSKRVGYKPNTDKKVRWQPGDTPLPSNLTKVAELDLEDIRPPQPEAEGVVETMSDQPLSEFPKYLPSLQGSEDITALQIYKWLEQELLANKISPLSLGQVGRNAVHLAGRYASKNSWRRLKAPRF